jgi:hypothetical protein
MVTENATAETLAASPASAKARRPHGTAARRQNEFATFNRIFNEIAGHRHRYEVFRDFVTVGALAFHNGCPCPSDRREVLEAEYLTIMAQHDKEAQSQFSALLAELVMLLDPEPRDILGQLFMQLDLGNERTGQFFTPSRVIRNDREGDVWRIGE